MGTASTMTSLAEALGMTCRAARTSRRPIRAADQGGNQRAPRCGDGAGGFAAVANHEREAFENAITVDMAIGGSTNAVVHLLAIAGRLGIELPLEKFDKISRRTPYIANVSRRASI